MVEAVAACSNSNPRSPHTPPRQSLTPTRTPFVHASSPMGCNQPRGGSSVPGLFLALLQTCLCRPVLLSGFSCSGHFYKLLSISLHTQLLYFSPSSLNSTTFDS